MIKKVLAALVLGSATLLGSAQTLFDNESNHTYLGVRAGLDISSASEGYGAYNNGAGFHAGVIYHIPVKMNFYFQPGLSFFYDTFGMTRPMNPQPGLPGAEGSIRNAGFRVPFDLGYHFDFTDDIKVYVFTGPQFNYSFSAKNHWNVNAAGFESESMFGDKGFKHFDLQWRFGAGISYGNYYVSMIGAPGITKVYKVSKVGFRRNLFELTFGYNF